MALLCASLVAAVLWSHLGDDAAVSTRQGGVSEGICPGCNVVLISVDATRADHLGCYGYWRNTTPFIDSLSREGVLFENAFAPRGATWPSLTSMLASRYPASTNVRQNGQLLDMDVVPKTSLLPGALGGAGYATAEFLSNFCESRTYGFAENRCFGNEKDRENTVGAKKWILNNSGGKFFIWIHYFAPHMPFNPPDEYDVFTDNSYRHGHNGSWDDLDKVTSVRENISASDLEYIMGLYDGEIRFSDSQVAEIYGLIRDIGLLNRTVFLVTADHGEELYQRQQYFYHDCSIYDSTLHIPLVVRLPDGKFSGRRVPQVVENIDIAPTLLDIVNVSPPKSFEGSSLIPLMGGRQTEDIRQAYGERGVDSTKCGPSEKCSKVDDSGVIYTVRTPKWRYVYNPLNITPYCRPFKGTYHIGFEELYDSQADSNESANVLADHPDVASALKEMLVTNYAQKGGQTTIKADEETVDKLKSLGYAA